jgi:hypothetical protein
MIRTFITAAAVLCCLLLCAPVSAQYGQGNSANNLFQQYTTSNGSATAGMYPAPHPVPNMGAQSYFTYQPLMPHEMMYQHSRNYYNYHNTGGYMGGYNSLNKTKVRWQSGASHIGELPFSTSLAGLQWKLHNKLYCIDGNCGGGGGLGLGSGGCRSGNCGGAVRGKLHGHGGRLRAGCASGNCN